MRDTAKWIGGVALWLGALLIGFYFTTTNSSDENDATAGSVTSTTAATTSTTTTTTLPPQTSPPETTTTTTAAIAATTTTTEAVTDTPTSTADGQPVLFAIPAEGPWLNATLTNGQFSLEGRIPSRELETGLLETAALVYGPTAVVNVEIDESVDSAPWLAGAPQGVALLPVMGSGSIGVSNDGVVVTGTSPNEAQYAAFEQATKASFAVDALTSGVEITNLGYPSFNTRRVAGSVVVTGQLANETDHQRIIAGAVAV